MSQSDGLRNERTLLDKTLLVELSIFIRVGIRRSKPQAEAIPRNKSVARERLKFSNQVFQKYATVRFLESSFALTQLGNDSYLTG